MEKREHSCNVGKNIQPQWKKVCEILRKLPQWDSEIPLPGIYPPAAAAAAAAKLLQSCPTLCDPIDGSPLGSPITGIFQTRTLEPLDRSKHGNRIL